jgi:hypothetical protein
VVEIKNAADENAIIKGAFNQLQTYTYVVRHGRPSGASAGSIRVRLTSRLPRWGGRWHGVFSRFWPSTLSRSSSRALSIERARPASWPGSGSRDRRARLDGMELRRVRRAHAKADSRQEARLDDLPRRVPGGGETPEQVGERTDRVIARACAVPGTSPCSRTVTFFGFWWRGGSACPPPPANISCSTPRRSHPRLLSRLASGDGLEAPIAR